LAARSQLVSTEAVIKGTGAAKKVTTEFDQRGNIILEIGTEIPQMLIQPQFLLACLQPLFFALPEQCVFHFKFGDATPQCNLLITSIHHIFSLGSLKFNSCHRR